MGKKISILLTLMASVFFLFYIKLQTQAMRSAVESLERAIVEEKKAIHMLHTEYAYLSNQEKKIMEVNKNVLMLKQIDEVMTLEEFLDDAKQKDAKKMQ